MQDVIGRPMREERRRSLTKQLITSHEPSTQFRPSSSFEAQRQVFQRPLWTVRWLGALVLIGRDLRSESRGSRHWPESLHLGSRPG